ncbi:MAG: hypothetical protein PWP69_1719 [Enterococcus sp.]|nr:hypothetical protein [Enterococcus sp.]MDK2844927.1 hypothetical protein [Enterococcus sp.]
MKSDKIKGNLKARVHVRQLGWMDWQDASKVVGTTGKALSLEALQLKLDGEIASSYDIYYRVHVQNFG